MRLNLQRQIREQLNKRYCKSRRPLRLHYLSLLASLSLLPPPGYAQTDEHYGQTDEDDEWHCRATHDSRWQCSKSALDWVPEEALSEAQKAELPSGCCGAYIEPERTDAEARLDPENAPLRASAKETRALGETDTYILEGEVNLTQGTRQLKADKVVLNRQANQADVEGDIELREPGVLLRSDKGSMNLDSRHATLSDAVFVMHESRVRGGAEKLEHLPNNLLILENGTYTSCEPDSKAWLLKGGEIVIDPNYEQVEGKDVRLEVQGVPVFYTPYLVFPISDARQSGLLFPYISTSDSGGGGVNAGIPYYFNLAPNYDMTLTPRHIDDHGEMLELEYRHLTPNFNTIVNLAHLSDDEGGKDDDDEELVAEAQADLDAAVEAGQPTAALEERLAELRAKVGEFIGEDRWLVNIDQIGGLSKRWGTRIDYTRVSDKDYFRDLDTASLSVNSQTHLPQLGEIYFQFDNWHLSAKAEQYQTLADNVLEINEPYRQTPRINASGHYRFGDWVLELENEYVSFDHKLKDSKVTGDRGRLDYRATLDKDWMWGFFKPALALKQLSYRLDDDFDHGIEEDPEVFVPQGTLDMGLIFERDGSLFGTDYLQTFEPRLFYFYSDFEDQSDLDSLVFDTSEMTFSYSQLFRDTRFAGGDRIDDANQLSAGLTTRIIESETGIERFSVSVGQIHYFADQRVALTPSAPEQIQYSEIASRITARLGNAWRLNGNLLYDEEQQIMSQGNMALKYMDDQYRLFNLGYRYVRQAGRADTNDIDNDGDRFELLKNDIDQAEASVLWPVYGNWSLIGRYNKDFTNDRELETFAGLEYNSCCYRIRAVWRRWLDNDLLDVIDDGELDSDEGVFFEFQLKGLGGTGTTLNSVLGEGIDGYDQRERHLK